MLRENILEILCCPVCKGDLVSVEEKLTCQYCKKNYDITDAIPVLINAPFISGDKMKNSYNTE